MPRVVVALALAMLWGALARAQTPTCDALTPAAKAVAAGVLAAQYPYDCCDDTLARCLQTRPDCRLPVRLADWVCRLAASGKDAAAVGRALEARAMTMRRSARRWDVDLTAAPEAGAVGAKVRVAAYVCLRCPLCAQLVPALYEAVTKGRLIGKVALYVRLFPIKSHEGSTEAALAAGAAAEQGKFWEYLLYAYGHFAEYRAGVEPDWAAAAGLERAAFVAARGSATVRERVVASKKEGLRNEVVSTPTLLIDGRKYVGELDLDTLVDVLEEAAE